MFRVLKWPVWAVREACSYPTKLGWVTLIVLLSLGIALPRLAWGEPYHPDIPTEARVSIEGLVRDTGCEFACRSLQAEISIYYDPTSESYGMLWTTEEALDRYFTTDASDLPGLGYNELQLTTAWTLQKYGLLESLEPVASVMRLEIIGVLRDQGVEEPRQYLQGMTTQEVLVFVREDIIPRKQEYFQASSSQVASMD